LPGLKTVLPNADFLFERHVDLTERCANKARFPRHRHSLPARFSSLWCALEQGQEFGCFDNLNALVVAQGEQMPITADEVLRLADDGTFQHRIIVGISGDDFQRARYRDYFREDANLVGGFRRFGCIEAAFELKFLGEFREDGFAGDGQTFAQTRGLDALVRVSQPAD